MAPRWAASASHDGGSGAPRRCVAAAESPDAGGSARDGIPVGHDGRGNRQGGRHKQVTAVAVERRAAGWWRPESPDAGGSA
jgi:hypothetical protein